MIEKIGAVHLIKSYGDEGRKYLKVPRIKAAFSSQNNLRSTRHIEFSDTCIKH